MPGQLSRVPPDSAGNDDSGQWTTVGLNGCAWLLALGRAVCVPLLPRHFLLVLSFSTACTEWHIHSPMRRRCVSVEQVTCSPAEGAAPHFFLVSYPLSTVAAGACDAMRR